MALAVLVAVWPAWTYAQDVEGGFTATLDQRVGLSYSDDDGTAAELQLGLSLRSQTRSQTLTFEYSDGLTYGLDGNGSLDQDDPETALSYSIENRNTVLSTALSYARSDTDDFVDVGSGAVSELVLDEGRREDMSASLDLTFGRQAPFGGTINLGFAQTNYTETASPTLFDTETRSLSTALRFDVDRRISATVSYALSDTERDGADDVTTESFSLGADLAVTPRLDANLSVGVTEITTDRGTAQTVEDGTNYAFRLTQDRPAGELSFGLNSDLSEAGRRTTASVTGVIETRRGNFQSTLGFSESETDELRPILSVSYREELARGIFSVSADQTFDVRDDGQETLNSRARIGWQQDLTRTSRLQTSLTYQATDVLGLADDTERLELGIGYSQDLTERWALSTRFTHAITQDDTSTRENENSVFIGLEASRIWRP